MENYILKPELIQIREYTFKILDKNSSVNTYTNINKLYRIEKNIKEIITQDNIVNIDFDSLFLANYIYTILRAVTNIIGFDYDEIIKNTDSIIVDLKEKFNTKQEFLEKAKTIVLQSLPNNQANTLESQILSDASVMDFACDQGRSRVKSLYEEMVLKDANISKSNWYDILISILNNYKTYTNFAKTEVQPAIDSLSKNLRKERKEIESRKELMVQKELKISDQEIKKLKKDLSKIKNRDDRGIQTLFRTTSKNHYTLNEMVDGKAKIMITINSIILSLFLGGLINESDSQLIGYIPTFVFSIANLISITFAIISITPNKTQGNFTEEEIRGKKGNLLFFGNFHNMHYRDFEWGFLQMLQDKDYLYTSMIRDFYYQGQTLHKKYSYIRISLFAFLLGLGLAILTHIIFKNYYI